MSEDEAAPEAEPSGGASPPVGAPGEAEPQEPDALGPVPGAAADAKSAESAQGTENPRPPTTDERTPEPPLEDADPDDGSLGDDERERGDRAAFDARIDGLDVLWEDGPSDGRPRASYGDMVSQGSHARIYLADKQFIYTSGPGPADRPRFGRLRPLYLANIRRTYVESWSHRELVDGFPRSPLQVLVGISGRGRKTTALAAVAAYVAPDGTDAADKVRLLEISGGAEAVAPSDLPADCGLVLALGAGVPVPGPAWFAQINRALAEPQRGSVLVVITDNAPPGLVDAELVHHAMPPLDQICERHLAAQLGPGPASELTAEYAVRTELAQYRSPREAYHLALDLAEGYRRGMPAEHVITNRDPSTLIKQINAQLTEHPAWQRAYLVTSAVLDGISVGTVVREASRLADLVEADGDARDGQRAERFTGPMREWARDCVELGDTDEGTGRTVRMVHRRLVAKVLEQVWQEHVGLRDAMLAWLKDLAVHPDIRVRVKGAQAAAKLASYDFDVIKREVLRTWANDGAFRTRQAVAWALEALALAEGRRFAPRVRGLVREWVRGSNVRLEAAGVAAYGTFLGAEYPDEALTSMRAVAAGRLVGASGQRDRVDRAERELANIVRSAVLEMFAAGAQEQVVAELARWTRTPMWRLRKCAAKCLVGLAARDGGLPGWPVLMELAAGQDSFRSDLGVLWRNALATENDPGPAWAALHRLILRAENAAQQWPAANGAVAHDGLSSEAARFRDLTRRLLTDIAGGERPADDERFRSLRFHIRLWEFRDRKRLTIIPDWMR